MNHLQNETILNALERRYATKQFDPTRTIPNNDLAVLKQALILSPSSFGIQPWEFILIQDKSLQNELLEGCYNQQQIADCDVLFVLCRKNNLSAEDIDAYVEDIAKTRDVSKESLAGYEQVMKQSLEAMNEQQRQHWADKQVYIALGFLLQTAALLKIDACPMEGFIPDVLAEKLQLNQEEIYPIVLCPVGYRSPDDKYQHAKKVRFDESQLINTRSN